MKKSKKIVLIVISCIVVLATIAGVIFGIVLNRPASIITKFEKKKAEEIAELKEKMPGYIFDADNRAGDVQYTILFNIRTKESAKKFMKKYNLKLLFPNAEIKISDTGTIRLNFKRNDYTQAVHYALKNLSKKSSITSASASVYSASSIKYKPDISLHTENPTELEYTVLDENALPKFILYDDEFINVDRIFLTKDDYDTYIDMLIASQKSEEPPEALETLKNIFKDKYNEDFFETNALLVTKEITRGSGRYRTTVDNVYISDNKIYVVIRTSCTPSEYPADMMVRETTFHLTVSKDAIKGATELITLD